MRGIPPQRPPIRLHDVFKNMKDILRRLKLERGTIYKQAKYRVGLLKPSNYFLSMSSLGLQVIYKLFNEADDFCAQRAFLPDDPQNERTILCYESRTPLANMDIIAISIAYELEIPDLMRCFSLIGLSPFAAQRDINAPLVLIGGPLSFSNMETLRDVADCMILGEGEGLIEKFCDVYRRHPHKSLFLEAAPKEIPEVWTPETCPHMPPCRFVDKSVLPAMSQIITPETEFGDMFMIESERGCHRRCKFCVMRREETAGMRLVPADTVCAMTPRDIKKVGLVGAAVSDHPELLDMVGRLVADGHTVSLSSLRTDRISEPLIDLLAQSGLKTLTIAADGPTEALRKMLTKDVSEEQLMRAAQIARERNMAVKLYVMIGLPGETDEDMDEFARFVIEGFSGLRLSLGVSPFVSKRHTPLDQLPFAGIKVVENRLKRLSQKLRGKAEIRSVSAKWAFIEHAFAQGGPEMAHIAYEAVNNGGKFSDWKRALLKAGKNVE